MDHTQPIDARKTIFIGGVPRPLKASELADIFSSRYGNVCYAGIDCDPDLKYPKGESTTHYTPSLLSDCVSIIPYSTVLLLSYRVQVLVE